MNFVSLKARSFTTKPIMSYESRFDVDKTFDALLKKRKRRGENRERELLCAAYLPRWPLGDSRVTSTNRGYMITTNWIVGIAVM